MERGGFFRAFARSRQRDRFAVRKFDEPPLNPSLIEPVIHGFPAMIVTS